MLKDKRILQILDILKRDGEVKINTLARIFNVSDVTIRRDIDILKKDHNIKKIHGGAILVDDEHMAEPSYDRRIEIFGDLKEKIAKKALEYIKPGQKVFIDSGTTTYHMAKNITNLYNNMVATNGINIASEIIHRRYINVILIGGDLTSNTLATRGALAEEMLQMLKFDVAFLGANALGEDGNLYIGNTFEKGIKNKVIQASTNTYVLLDSSKFNKYNLITYSHARDITGVITDNKIPKKIIDNLSEMGVNIIIAD